MACLTKSKLIEYIDGETGSIESSMIRDHLLMCDKCSEEHRKLVRLEKLLREPEMVIPPEKIISGVMRRVRRRVPTYTSVAVMIAMSMVLFATWIYIYLDFANNSLVHSLSHSSGSLGNILSGGISIISTIFAYVYSIFTAIDKMMNMMLNVSPGVNVIGASLISISLVISYFVWSRFTRFFRSTN